VTRAALGRILSALLLVVTLRHRGRDRPLSPHHDITSLHHHQHHHQLQQQQQQRGRGGGGRCRRLVVGLYLLLRAVYSLAFTFSGLLMACRLLTTARSTTLPFNRVLGEESVVQVLTTATRPLHRRLAELERLGGLSWKLSCKLSPKLSWNAVEHCRGSTVKTNSYSGCVRRCLCAVSTSTI